MGIPDSDETDASRRRSPAAATRHAHHTALKCRTLKLPSAISLTCCFTPPPVTRLWGRLDGCRKNPAH
jgi:hypothetical protein